MKSQKGITLISLIVYIMVMLIVIAILSTVSTTFYKNMKTINTDGIFAEETSKINLYILQDIKEKKLQIDTISNDKILLKNSQNSEQVTYLSAESGIYRNEVLICENIKATFMLQNDILKILLEYTGAGKENVVPKTLEINV